MKNKYDKIFKKEDCISEELLLKYANKKASLEEQHEVEFHTIDCDMCADMLEGLLLQKEQRIDLNKNIQDLEEKIDNRVNLAKQPQKQWQWLAMAASIALLIGIGFYLYKPESEKQLAQELPKKEVEVDKPAIDSVKNTNEQTENTEAAEQVSQKNGEKVKTETKAQSQAPKISSTVCGEELVPPSQNEAKQPVVFEKDNSVVGGFAYTENQAPASSPTINIASDSTIVADQAADMYKIDDLDKVIDYKKMDSELKDATMSNAITPKEEMKRSATFYSYDASEKPSVSSSSDLSKKQKTASSKSSDKSESANNMSTMKLQSKTLDGRAVIYSSANVYTFLQPTSSIDFVNTSGAFSLSSTQISNLVNTINSTTFNTTNPSVKWKYIIALTEATTGSITYIALSEDEKTVMKSPNDTYSNSPQLINVIKSLLQ